MIDIAEQIINEILNEVLEYKKTTINQTFKIDNIFYNNSANFVKYCDYISSK